MLPVLDLSEYVTAALILGGLAHVSHPLRISECAELLEPLVLDLTDALARDV